MGINIGSETDFFFLASNYFFLWEADPSTTLFILESAAALLKESKFAIHTTTKLAMVVSKHSIRTLLVLLRCSTVYRMVF